MGVLASFGCPQPTLPAEALRGVFWLGFGQHFWGVTLRGKGAGVKGADSGDSFLEVERPRPIPERGMPRASPPVRFYRIACLVGR